MVWQPETMKGDKRQDNRYNKSDVFIAGIANMYVNVRGGCMWSSARMGYVISWYGRVVVVVVRSRTFDEGSWHRLSRGDTARCLQLVSWIRSGHWIQLEGCCGQLRSVELFVSKSISQFWNFIGMVESWLLACNSESLRGLDAALPG